MGKVIGMNTPVTSRAAGVRQQHGSSGRSGIRGSIGFGASPVWSARTPPDGQSGVAYTYTFVASGTPAPIYELDSGTLPTGLTLNATTGVLAGTPSAAGTFAFVIKARNSFYPAVLASESVVIAVP